MSLLIEKINILYNVACPKKKFKNYHITRYFDTYIYKNLCGEELLLQVALSLHEMHV